MNAEKDQSLELPEVSDHQAQSREPRVITRILCWTFFYAEMLLVCAWSTVRWRWRTRSLRPLTCWCREFSPSSLISSLLLAPQTIVALLHTVLHTGNSFIQSIFGGGVLLIWTFLLADKCSQYLHILSLHLQKSHSIVGHLTAKLNKERLYFLLILTSSQIRNPVILRVHLILLTSNEIEKLATDSWNQGTEC